ncbi:MAG: hypothetical protein Q9191_005425 [Dirinaria sp. TL-2023a]
MGILSCFSSIPRQWRTPKTIIGLFVLELCISIATLALYGIAQPDLYRTKLWQEGSLHGWNSSPSEIIYAYANYRPISTPLPWSSWITKFNVVIAVLSLFLLLVKGIMFITHVFYPLLSVLVHALLVALYAVSIHAQTASDMSDPEHPQHGAPWYITRGCGAPVSEALVGYCKQAKAVLAVTVLLCALFTAYLLLSLFSLYPTRSFRASRSSKIDEADEEAARPWEMGQVPPPPTISGGLKSPTTPRTMAFQTLSGDRFKGKGKKKAEAGTLGIGLGAGGDGERPPLRHHISMGDERREGMGRMA